MIVFIFLLSKTFNALKVVSEMTATRQPLKVESMVSAVQQQKNRKNISKTLSLAGQTDSPAPTSHHWLLLCCCVRMLKQTENCFETKTESLCKLYRFFVA